MKRPTAQRLRDDAVPGLPCALFVIRHRPLVQCLFLLTIVFLGSGATCSRSLRNPFAPMGPPAPEVLTAGATLEQVVSAVNLNAGRVHSYQTNDASITVPGVPGIPLLRGNIVAQRPGRLRLQASTALTGPEVDLGSNDELFWFWVKRNEPPALYFSRHDQFVGSAAQQVLPMDPKWLLDALGMAQFSPNDQHQGPVPHGDGTLEIRSFIQTAAGTMTKSTVIDDRRAWVLEQHIYASSGQLMASSRARSHRYYPDMGLSLPQEIDIRLPAMQLALTIDVGAVLLNQVAENSALWSLPVLSGYPQIDLGTAAPGTIPSVGSGAAYQVPTPTPALALPSNPAVESREQSARRASAGLVGVPYPLAQKPVAQQLPPGGIPASALAR
ncbi:MAG: hypothetical protein KDA57_12855 [Planctomycetales bacterium]|nr:hypothetical protein [Planctomycetales bacterium]